MDNLTIDGHEVPPSVHDYIGIAGALTTDKTKVQRIMVDVTGQLVGPPPTFTYDANGNVATEARTIGATTYTRSFTYDANGNLLTVGAWA